MGRASLKQGAAPGAPEPAPQISRPYGPGLIEAETVATCCQPCSSISRPYGPGLIEACRRGGAAPARRS